MRGGCLCGQVRFEADAPLRDVVACHCTQCRKTSGHFWAATSVPHDRFRLTESTGLRWFQSSDIARRGFCGTCGSSLFWEPVGENRISIAAGALEGPTALKIIENSCLEDKGDYYDIPTA
ncbi:MAG: aldehyde-activating protein [Cypionkella sp.]|uniref:GFA family protein n=1 Tax=Cypionkella sp. TaxID=2811411 RepID=UPI0026243836|nr:GFA family protein [Cypionkella sp.]MDB5660972.1 aldehyde-activating protein [Cypionkella sp.]